MQIIAEVGVQVKIKLLHKGNFQVIPASIQAPEKNGEHPSPVHQGQHIERQTFTSPFHCVVWTGVAGRKLEGSWEITERRMEMQGGTPEDPGEHSNTAAKNTSGEDKVRIRQE